MGTTKIERALPTEGEAKEYERELKAQNKETTKQVNRLIANTTQYLMKVKRLAKLKEPIAILLRDYGDIEIHEDITGSTWVIPERPGKKKKPIELGETELTKGKKVAYLHSSALYKIRHGPDTMRCYVIHENDAMPVGADPKAWSEMLENIMQAIFINYRQMLEKLKNNTWVGIVDVIKWGGLIFIGILLVRWLIGDGAPDQTAQVAQQVVDSGITIIE